MTTTDGTHLYLQTSGSAQKNGELHLRIKIEASTISKYAWLNDLVVVGVLKTLEAGPEGLLLKIDAWTVSSITICVIRSADDA